MVASIANAVLSRGDIWLAGIFLSDTDVAVYGGAARLVLVMALPIAIASAVLAPTISQLYTRGERQRLERAMRIVATFAAAPALIIFLLMALLGEQILGLLYSDDLLKGGWPVLAILGAAQLINASAGVCTQLLIMSGKQVVVLKLALLTVIVALVVSALLVDTLGIIGIAIGFAGGEAFRNFATVLYARHRLGLKTHMLTNPADILAIRKMLLPERRRQ